MVISFRETRTRNIGISKIIICDLAKGEANDMFKNIFGTHRGTAEDEVLEPNGRQYEPKRNKLTTPRQSRWVSTKIILGHIAEQP